MKIIRVSMDIIVENYCMEDMLAKRIGYLLGRANENGHGYCIIDKNAEEVTGKWTAQMLVDVVNKGEVI